MAENTIEVGDVYSVIVNPDMNYGRMGRVQTIKGDFIGLTFAKKDGEQESMVYNYKLDQIKFHSKDVRKKEGE